MEFLFLFFILFGVGAILGLAYVGIKAIMMAAKGLRFAAKDLKRVNAESAAKGRALADEWAAKKKERLRAQP